MNYSINQSRNRLLYRNEFSAESKSFLLPSSQRLSSSSSLCSLLSSSLCLSLPLLLFYSSYSVSHPDPVVFSFGVSSITVQEFRTLYAACMTSLCESSSKWLLTHLMTLSVHITALLQIVIFPSQDN